MTRPCIIAGPCSAESEDQVLRTAEALSGASVCFFRAGLWKPRTMPGCFEGVGAAGIPWLLKVRDLGLRPCTEVASASHVRECMAAGLDAFWIGARTTANPFLVQEIADALAEGGPSGVAVFVKNPVNPDLDLWLGAIERLQRAGVKDVTAVHRGFTPAEKMRYRNDPMWRIPVEFRTRRPDIPLLCDPSHLAGAREYILEVSRRALNLGFDGLMVEVHCCPEAALSDSAQQLSPDEFRALVASVSTACAPDDGRLAGLRESIDIIDESLIRSLAARMAAVKEIGEVKKESGLSIIQASRWDKVLARVLAEGRAAGLDDAFVREIFSSIHREAVRIQDSESPEN